jgi:hypothetical protein
LTNRVVPALIAVCLAIAAPPERAIGSSNPTAAADSTPAVAAHVDVEPEILRTAVGAAIDPAYAADAGVSTEVLSLAIRATSCAVRSGAVDTPPTLTIIDYSRPSTEPRLWVFDLGTGKVLFKELVAHGKNTGENFATEFSNDMNSLQTSLGLFVTDEPYFGGNGYSLRLDGLDVGFNDRARERAIVMHGASYVDAELASRQGRIGRSWGCPAVSTAVAAEVIDRIRGGGVIFSYYPNPEWLSSSRYLQGCPNS